MHDRFSTLSVKRLQRRLLLQFIGYNSALIGVNKHPVFAAPLPEMKEPEVIRTLKLANGVKFQDIVEGKGPEAREGDLVEVNYVCRRSNGYFVHSTVDQFSGESAPVILPLDENKIIKGLKEVLLGMKVGGKRRALIPPSVGYVNANLNPIPEEFGPRRSLLSHANEPLIFEVQLLKVL
ncbi:peptidyl-prolyl cis-trans isomerase FKBP16-1, chloroplastic-like isoform X3 [Mangifera indica]|nr:peptidyl-prolyl cis-trans isomerase FKBP16-1, chloroplastic-like isoform X3 [Mangifera indica]